MPFSVNAKNSSKNSGNRRQTLRERRTTESHRAMKSERVDLKVGGPKSSMVDISVCYSNINRP